MKTTNRKKPARPTPIVQKELKRDSADRRRIYDYETGEHVAECKTEEDSFIIVLAVNSREAMQKALKKGIFNSEILLAITKNRSAKKRIERWIDEMEGALRASLK